MTLYNLDSAALVHGKQAWGARHFKAGFSFSPQMDLAFALGFPHLKLMAKGHPDDADPLASYPKRWTTADPVVFPEKVMRCWLKDAATKYEFRDAGEAPWVGRLDEPFTERELWGNGAPLGPLARYRMMMLEAFESPDVVLEIAMKRLRACVEEEAQRRLLRLSHTGVSIGLSALLLRVPGDLRARCLDELAGFGKRLPHGDDNIDPFHDGLDELLGRGGELQRGYVIQGNASPTEILDDLCETDMSEGWEPDARAAFFGGEAIIDLMRKRFRDMNQYARAQLFDQYSWIRSAAVVELFVDMMSVSKLERRILDWFADRAAFTRPILADLEKNRGALAPAARKALAQVDKALSGGQKPAAGTKRPAAKKPADRPATGAAKKKARAKKKKPPGHK
jgi:hypothetical protein